MSIDLDTAAQRLNTATDRVDATTQFLADIIEGGEGDTIHNPKQGGQSSPTVKGMVKQHSDEFFAALGADMITDANASHIQEQIIGLNIYPPSTTKTATTIAPYNTCPAGTTALRDAANGKLYKTSEIVEGTITSLNFVNRTATVGGKSVGLLDVGSGGAGVEWSTITGDASVVRGKGYLMDTSGLSSEPTIKLPASPAIGDMVGFGDYNGSFGVRGCNVHLNGKKFMGQTEDLLLETSNVVVVAQYVDATVGWKIVSGVGLGNGVERSDVETLITQSKSIISTGSSVPRTLEERFTDIVNCADYGILPDGNDHTSAWLNLVDVVQPAVIFIPEGEYKLKTFKVKANSEVFGAGANRTKINLWHDGSASVVMGQINSNTYVHDLHINSTESDLEWQRCSLETARHVTLERMIFTGFKNPTNMNAWGLYMKDSRHIRILQCGFSDNSQSDIAITDQVKNVLIEGCYAITSALHINMEPNASTSGNQGICIRGSKLSQLSLLENGSGGTGTSQVTIESCEIEELVYDGTYATMIDCKINSFSNQSLPFMGSLGLVNTIGLKPNLLDDPYFCNFGFNQSQSLSDNNSWYMRGRAGAIGTNQLDAMSDGKLRYTRINPNALAGTVYFAPAIKSTLDAGKTYCIAITGRRIAGTSGRFMSIESAATGQIDFRLFRHSNAVAQPWITEVVFLTITDTSDYEMKVGNFVNSEVVDICSISLHEVDKHGTNARRVLDQIHEVGGPRVIEVLGKVVSSSADVRSLQSGDILKSAGSTWVWDTDEARILVSEDTSNAGDPNGVVEPTHIGQSCYDTVGSKWYKAYGSGASGISTWILLN
ncbi:hypothetical protein MYOV003v1_p0050 [Vibrio phage 207E48.1]|nr:hypothetical protein MYOV003v1_p0050 [Vibrio phage 207E48.1]